MRLRGLIRQGMSGWPEVEVALRSWCGLSAVVLWSDETGWSPTLLYCSPGRLAGRQRKGGAVIGYS